VCGACSSPDHPAVEAKVIAGLLGLIERERLGESVNRSLLKSLLRMFSALKLYDRSFTSAFLDATRAFYTAESAKNLATSSPTEYIHYIQHRLQQEEDRALAYLDESTRAPLTTLMQAHLIEAHSHHLLSVGFQQLLEQKRSVELSILYKLFERVKALDDVRDSFGEYVKKTACDIVQSGSIEPAEAAATAAAAAASASSSAASVPAVPALSVTSTPANMITDLLRLKLSLDDLMKFSFASNGAFLASMKDAFETAMNSVDSRPAELIAKFMDRVLRLGGKGIKITPTTVSTGEESAATGLFASTSITGASSAHVPIVAGAAGSSSVGGEDSEFLLDECMFLFRGLTGKDVFQAFYKKDLAKRLLLNKSASIDAEKSLIVKMKNECGPSFTTKLEGMFKDMELSKDIQTEYEQVTAEQKAQRIAAAGGDAAAAGASMDLSVQVLTTGSWPAYVPLECTLPRDVARAHEGTCTRTYARAHVCSARTRHVCEIAVPLVEC
jgi:cullin-4